MKKKLLKLKKNLNSKGLHREAKQVDKLIKIALTDEQLERTQERQSPEYKKEMEEREKARLALIRAGTDQSDINFLDKLELVADILGLLPGVGAVADVVSLVLSLYQKKWVSSVFNLIGIVPEIGTPIKLALKGLSKIPAGFLVKYGQTLLEGIAKYIEPVTQSAAAKFIFKSSVDTLKGKIAEYIDQALKGNDITMNGSPVKSSTEGLPPELISEINPNISGIVSQTIGDFPP